jgi:hypothetical protein
MAKDWSSKIMFQVSICKVTKPFHFSPLNPNQPPPHEQLRPPWRWICIHTKIVVIYTIKSKYSHNLCSMVAMCLCFHPKDKGSTLTIDIFLIILVIKWKGLELHDKKNAWQKKSVIKKTFWKKKFLHKKNPNVHWTVRFISMGNPTTKPITPLVLSSTDWTDRSGPIFN